ncbi:hypothetical protein DPEC_G00228410 [Dallia pectoralis]|uniref:Uncharacterized protein n=1 Tax=Dallia pectoralis TaxID=75939 RepID=A0ACC2G1H3_DALPE|nr:hypothetical protein DPEC_G00228410 [Dallia pectoralis]
MQQHLIQCIFLASCLKLCTGSEWCYESQHNCGSPCNVPEKWGHANENCFGNAQSPINIVHRKTLPDERLTPFQFKYYQHSIEALIKNNGHSVQVNLNKDAYVNGGHLEMPYKALQFHLHWGRNGGPGSEHTVDGEQYPMELHIVHIKEKYSNLEDALKDSTGVAVLGFFYEESISPNRKYEPIIKAIRNITAPGTNTPLVDLSLEQLILPPENMTNYYRYLGSLTTPGCTEAVIWTVFEKPIYLSKEQLQEFSKLRFKDDKPMMANFRPVQPLNNRKVYRSGGAVVVASAILLVASIAMVTGLSQPD